jgi:hypothetical protein
MRSNGATIPGSRPDPRSVPRISGGDSRGAHRHQIHDPFHESQAEIREVLIDIINDVETANVLGLRDSHLNSDKFTKFGGTFERINIDQCIEGEIAGITSVRDLRFEMKDRKIDVFGDVAIMTCYNHFSYKDNGGREQRVARNTLVFLKTDDGWKIVHEHVTPKQCFED